MKKEFSKLKPNKKWSFSDASKLDTNAYTHSYHRYPAKFIPQIVNELLSKYTKDGDTVLDPFGGCGTTLVESKMLGRKSIGIDINPIAKLITQVKVTPINPNLLERELDKLIISFKKYSSKSRTSKIKKSDRILYWFNELQFNELNYMYSSIRKIKNRRVQKFFLVAFSHNLKNSSKWLMKSIKPTIDKNKIYQSSIKTFIRHSKSMIKKNSEYFLKLKQEGNLNTSSKMYRQNSTKPLPVKSNSIDLIVTSPPYVTSYEYADLHQLSLLWFGNDPKFNNWNKYISNFSSFKKDFVGTTKSKGNNKGDYNSLTASKIIQSLKKKKSSLANSVGDYFIDMNKSFTQMYRVLKKGSHACIIIGNTNLKNIPILNAEVALEQMKNTGFKKVKLIKREAISNKVIAPWRDLKTGRFTGRSNKRKRIAYQYEYILIMKKGI